MAIKREFCKKCPFKTEEVKPFIFIRGRYFCTPECPDYREILLDSRISASALDKVIKEDMV